MLVARNLAYLSQVESTLSYSRKLAALGRLSAGIAHEVKNPLNATMIHLELLKMQLAESARRDGTPDGHRGAGAAARRSRAGLPEIHAARGPEAAAGARWRRSSTTDAGDSRRGGASHGVDVRVECPPDLPPVSADPGLLEQAFLNLALNACQAMPHGGRLRIAATRAAGPPVEVVFEDTGVGIAPEQLARIFDLYFTTKEHGSGIGLSLVYRTVQLHDGEIEVQSVPGRGTTFRLLAAAGRRQLRRPPPQSLRHNERDHDWLPRSGAAALLLSGVVGLHQGAGETPAPMPALDDAGAAGAGHRAGRRFRSRHPSRSPRAAVPPDAGGAEAARPRARRAARTPPPTTTPTPRADAARSRCCRRRRNVDELEQTRRSAARLSAKRDLGRSQPARARAPTRSCSTTRCGSCIGQARRRARRSRTTCSPASCADKAAVLASLLVQEPGRVGSASPTSLSARPTAP